MRGGASFRRSPRGPTGNEVPVFCTEGELAAPGFRSLRHGGVGEAERRGCCTGSEPIGAMDQETLLAGQRPIA